MEGVVVGGREERDARRHLARHEGADDREDDAADDERRAQQEAERDALRAKREKDAAAAEAKAEAAAALKAERVKMFEAGSLSIDELKYDEIQHQLSRLGVPGKERVGKKEDLRAQLKEVGPNIVGKKRKTHDDNVDATGFTKPINVDNPNPDRARRGKAKASYAETDDED